MTEHSQNLQSPSESVHSPPTLDRLITHFVAAKKSLSSTSQVYRANEIVQDARKALEEAAVLKAKNTFIRNGADEELHVLQAVGTGLDTVGREAQVDFQVSTVSLVTYRSLTILGCN